MERKQTVADLESKEQKLAILKKRVEEERADSKRKHEQRKVSLAGH